MALTIGELVGFIRADDSGFQRGLDAARLRMRGLQRDADGTLRDLRGRFISEGDAAGRGLADGIRAHAEMAAPAVKKVGTALLAVGVGVPAVSAATAALGGLAAGAAAAGLAVKAFSLAVGPQMEDVSEAMDLAAKAEQAAAEGGAAAVQAQEELAAALQAMPPATRDMAQHLMQLREEHRLWSDEMSATTMPVFTKGIQILRSLLPQLTPFVKAAADAFGGFLDDVAAGIESARFKEWAADMSAAAGPALSNFLKIIKNLAIGFAGLLQAFLPASDGVTGGLVEMTEAFADWGAGLKDSEGFAQFLDLAREGGQTLGTLAGAALDVFVALSPLIGITAQIALYLAQLINKVPPDVLTAIGAGFAAIALGVKAYGLYTRIAAAVTRAWAIAQGLFNAVMMMNPVGLVIAAIVALVAIIVVAYQKSERFRAIVQAAWAAVQVAITVAVAYIRAAINRLAELPGKISRWFGQAKDWAIRKWNELVAWVRGLPGRVSAALSGLSGALHRRAVEAGRSLVNATRQKLSEAISWVRGLPGRARSALGNLNGTLAAAGRALIRGFISGIKSMIGSAKDAARSVVSSVRNLFPFSPAKEGPFAGRGYTSYSGRALIAGFGEGIEAQAPRLRAQMASVLAGLPTMTLPSHAMPGVSTLPGASGVGAVQQPQPIVLKVEEGAGGRIEALLTHIIRETVAVKGGGDVQRAFGRGR